MVSIVEKIRENSLLMPEKPVAVFENDELSYGELWHLAVKMSDYLKKAGVEKGDRILFQSCYTRWFVVCCFAAQLCHAVFVPMDKRANGDMIKAVCEKLGAKCVISESKVDFAEISITYQELPNCAEKGEENAALSFPGDDEYANIMFTTGTTGNPKGVILSHKNINAIVRIGQADQKIEREDVGIMFLPLNHIGPIRLLYRYCFAGGTCIFLDGILKLKKMYEFMEKYGVNTLYVPPSGLSAMSQFGSDKIAEFSSQLKNVYLASSSISETQQNYLRNNLPNSNFYFMYGSSESGTDTSYQFDHDKRNVACVGKPYNGVSIRVVDDDMKDMETGKVGTVVIKSDMNFVGYWNEPKLTENAFKDGYYVSSDAGYFDDEGFLYIVGRKDDVINVGGLKVFPTEIENELLKLEGVSECICFPVPDNMTGKAVKLLAVKKEGALITQVDIKNHLSKRLDAYKIPRYIEFTDHIEKTPNGKPNRKAYIEK